MNILLIDVDTLRADHLGCYGYGLPTSPNIDRFAAESLLFENCFAPGVPTTPAHTTIYTGLHPIEHNIVSHGGATDLDRHITVLPEQLQKAGLTTAAVDNLYRIKPWLARGYEFYIDPSFKHKAGLLVTAEEINRRALAWLRAYSTEPFFLFLHYWDPHTPYLPPARHRLFYAGDDPFDPAIRTLDHLRTSPFWNAWGGDSWFQKIGPVTDSDYLVALYDGEVHYVDDAIGAILNELDLLGLADSTLVIITGDHGESMTEHGIFFDHHGLYDNNTRVPLIVRQPGTVGANTRCGALVQQMDIAPSLISSSGGVVPPTMRGCNLIRGPVDGYSEIVCCENTWQKKWALRTREYKLIVSVEPDSYGSPRRELYSMVDDPGELHNLAEVCSGRADSMEERLSEWIKEQLSAQGKLRDPLLEQEVTLGSKVRVAAEPGR